MKVKKRKRKKQCLDSINRMYNETLLDEYPTNAMICMCVYLCVYIYITTTEVYYPVAQHLSQKKSLGFVGRKETTKNMEFSCLGLSLKKAISNNNHFKEACGIGADSGERSTPFMGQLIKEYIFEYSPC